MADDIVVGSVAVDIVPDTSRFREELAAKMKGITVDIPVVADLDRFRAELDDATRDRETTIRANADTAAASAQLDEAARDRTARISVADGGGLSRASQGLGGLATAAVTLGPTLIPILATVAAIGLALGAPIAIAAGGATVFGFLAGFAVKQTNKQLKDIDTTRKKLAGLTKGTAEYKAAQQLLKSQLDGLSPAQKKYAASLDHIKNTFAGLIGGKTGQQLLGPVAAFLDTVAKILPKLSPVIAAVSGALTILLGDLGNAAKGPEFSSFIHAVSAQLGPDLIAFGKIAGNIFGGLAGLLVTVGKKFGGGVLDNLISLTNHFADFGKNADKSKALQKFFDYFHRVGPQVGDTLGAVAKAIGHIVEALAPLGPPILKVVEGIANAISGIPIPVLTALAGAFIAMAAASKVSKGLSAVGLLRGNSVGAGALGGLISSAKPVPVFVTNPGFGGGVPGGGGGGGPIVPVDPRTGKPLGVVGGAEAEARAAAKAAAELVRANGGDAGRASEAAARAFKDAMAAHDAAVFKSALSFGVKGGLRGILGTILSPVSALALNGENGSHRIPGGTSPNFGTQFLIPANGKLPTSFPDSAHLKASTDGFDALKAHAAAASRTIDLIGPHANDTFRSAGKDVSDFVTKLDQIHDKKITVLLNDLAAVQSLQALQALRLKDKTLSVNVELQIERAVGPGGGIGHPTGPTPNPRLQAPNHRLQSPDGPSTKGGPLVNIQNAHLTDTNDLLRKSQDALIARGGGGVLLRPPATASLV